MLDGKLEGLSADLMWEASGGNALFLHHLVEGAIEAKTLRQVRGVWQLRGRAAITSELASLLESRIDALPEEILHALSLLTFCEPIDIEVLSELAGEEAIEEAERRGLVKVADDGADLTVQFVHPLFGEVIRRRLGRASARRLRGQLVGALRSRPLTTATDRIRLAELALDSDKNGDLDLFATAAADATLLADHPLGERFARAAVERGGGLRAAELLARTLLWQGRPDEAEAALADFAPDTLDQAQLISWGAVRIMNLFYVAHDATKADEVLALLKQRVTHPSLALIVTAMAFADRGVREQARRGARRVGGGARPTRTRRPWAVEYAAFGGMLALALMGRGSEVAPMASRFHDVMNATDGLLQYPASLGEMLGMIHAGQLDLAQRRADESTEFSSPGHFLAWAMANILLGMVDLAKGRLPEAATRNEQALAALTGDASWTYPSRITLVQAYAAQGKVAEGQRALADAQARFGRHVAIFGPHLRLAEAWLAAAEGTVTPAIAKAHMAAAEAAESKQYAMEADALHTAARFGDKTVGERLGELAGDLDGKLIEVHAQHAQAVAADDGVALDAAAAEYERLGALLSAADAAAQAASAHERAEGRGADSAGIRSRRAFLESAATANRLAAACGGAVTPTLRAAAQPLPLTVREREIANLVAAGLSNKEIAERLTVSVRTVEGHLYRACTKLDVPDREALAALLRSAG